MPDFSSLTERLLTGTHKAWMFVSIITCSVILSTSDSPAKINNLGSMPPEYTLNDSSQLSYDSGISIIDGSYIFSSKDSWFPEFDINYWHENPGCDDPHGFAQEHIDLLKREVINRKNANYFFDDVLEDLGFIGSGDSEGLYTSGQQYDTISYIFDWRYGLFPVMALARESFFTNTHLPAYNETKETKTHGYAHRLTTTDDSRPGRVTFKHEKVSPDYTAIAGAAISDRERFNVKWQYKYKGQHTITSGILWERNNLKNIFNTRYDRYKPEIKLITEKLFGRKTAVTDISYKIDIIKKNTISSLKMDHIVNIKYRDRVGIFDTVSNLGFTSSDNSDINNKNLGYIYNTTLKTKVYHPYFTFKPGLHLGGRTSKEKLSGCLNRIYEYLLETDLDIHPVKLASNIQVGQNRFEKGSGSVSMKNFARLNIYYRPDFLLNQQGGMIFLKAHINNYRYDIADADFRETSITSGVNLKF